MLAGRYPQVSCNLTHGRGLAQRIAPGGIPAGCSSKRHKAAAKRQPQPSAAAMPVLDPPVESSAPPQQSQESASSLPSSWSLSELDDEQISTALKARRLRSNSLAQTSKSLEAGLDGAEGEGHADNKRQAKKQRSIQNRQSLRSRSTRGASRQGHTHVRQKAASPSSEPLNAEQECEVCKAIQRFQEIQSVRRTLLERAGAKEGKEPECSDQEWAEAAQEPSTKALGAALTRGQRALAALIQSYTPAINKFATEYTKKGVDYDEAAEAAGTALTHAATLFDTTRGGRLSTYVWPSIHRTLIKLVDQQSNVMRLPPRSRQRLRQLNETYHALTHALGRPPSMAEVAAEAKMSLRHAIALRRTMQGVSSFEAEMTGAGSSDQKETAAERLATDEGAEDDFESELPNQGEEWHREFMDRLAMCMDLLADQRAAQAVRLRYGVIDGKQRTWDEVAKDMKPKISATLAYQLTSKAFDQLRSSEWRMRPLQPLLEDMQKEANLPQRRKR